MSVKKNVRIFSFKKDSKYYSANRVKTTEDQTTGSKNRRRNRTNINRETSSSNLIALSARTKRLSSCNYAESRPRGRERRRAEGRLSFVHSSLSERMEKQISESVEFKEIHQCLKRNTAAPWRFPFHLPRATDTPMNRRRIQAHDGFLVLSFHDDRKREIHVSRDSCQPYTDISVPHIYQGGY